MRIAIIGLPGSGKTTLFDAITGHHEQPGHYAAPGSIQLGVVPVLDERVDFVAEVYQPKKHTYAHLEFADVAGLFAGAKPAPEAVEAVRNADALVKVVRAFHSEAVPHVKGSVDPARDLEELEADLFVVDLDIIERRIERLRDSVRRPTPEQEQDKVELALLERCREQLESVGALDRLELSDDERKMLSGFAFLTQKPSVVVLNIGEDQIADERAALAPLGERAVPTLAVSAEIEKEILELEPDERQPFLADLGLAELSGQKLVHAALEAMNVITFITGGDKEVRAWLVRRGASAVEAAGEVHTDFAKGFIRAEVIPVDDLRAHGSLKEVRAHGKERLEGKDYVVADGDILQIRFSV